MQVDRALVGRVHARARGRRCRAARPSRCRRSRRCRGSPSAARRRRPGSRRSRAGRRCRSGAGAARRRRRAPRRCAASSGPSVASSAGVERALVRGAEHVRGVDLLVLVVEDRRLDGPVEELVGVAAEELVERVLAGDVDREPAAAAPGAAPHLPQRGDRARERDADRGVERADVDAELERVGGDDAEQLALDEPALDLAPLLGRVAGAVGRDPLARARPGPCPRARASANLAISSTALRDFMKTIVRAPCGDELGQQVGRLGERRAPRRELLVGDRRVPHRDRAVVAGRAVLVDDREVVEARSAARRARPGWRSSRWPARSAARCRRRRRPAAAAAARCRRASRTRRGRRAPRRRRRPRGWRRSRAHARWLGRIPTCSMSGLVSTTLARRRIAERCSRGVSPS